MFIYKITVLTTNKVYIGLDTKPEYKESRWKAHCKDSIGNAKRKVHVAMKEAGLENCKYEILERDFHSVSQLAISEINYIKKYDAYNNGLNSSPGGDGIGKHDLTSMTENDICMIREALGEHWTEYNKKKWAGMSAESRKKATSHLHTDEIYQKKADTLKKFYESNPTVKAEKGTSIKKWQEENKDIVCRNNKENGMKGALKVSKEVVVETIDGVVETFYSRSEFQRKTGMWFTTLLDKSAKGEYHKGYRIKG